MLISIDEAARRTGVVPLDIARMIHSTRLEYIKGPDGKKGIELSTLRGINGFVPPMPPPAPKPTVKTRVHQPEVPVWYPSAIEMLEIIKLDDRGRAERLAVLTRQHPHLRTHFRENPLPPVFKRRDPPAKPADPVIRTPEPPVMPQPQPSPVQRPVKRSIGWWRGLGILILGALAYQAYPTLRPAPVLFRPQPIVHHHIVRHTARRRRLVHNPGWPSPPPWAAQPYGYQTQ